MKLQLLFAPALLLAIAADLLIQPKIPATLLACIGFVVSTLPFAWRAIAKDPVVALLSPGLLAARACAQGSGVTAGLIHVGRKQADAETATHA